MSRYSVAGSISATPQVAKMLQLINEKHEHAPVILYNGQCGATKLLVHLLIAEFEKWLASQITATPPAPPGMQNSYRVTVCCRNKRLAYKFAQQVWNETHKWAVSTRDSHLSATHIGQDCVIFFDDKHNVSFIVIARWRDMTKEEYGAALPQNLTIADNLEAFSTDFIMQTFLPSLAGCSNVICTAKGFPPKDVALAMQEQAHSGDAHYALKLFTPAGIECVPLTDYLDTRFWIESEK